MKFFVVTEHSVCMSMLMFIASLLKRHCYLQIHVQIKFLEPTELGLEFLQSDMEQAFCVYPEADMLLSESRCKSYSSFSEWGKGWADPEIRRQRLEGRQSHKKSHKSRKPRKRKSRKSNPESGTVRGRLTAKLLKKKS